MTFWEGKFARVDKGNKRVKEKSNVGSARAVFQYFNMDTKWLLPLRAHRRPHVNEQDLLLACEKSI